MSNGICYTDEDVDYSDTCARCGSVDRIEPGVPCRKCYPWLYAPEAKPEPKPEPTIVKDPAPDVIKCKHCQGTGRVREGVEPTEWLDMNVPEFIDTQCPVCGGHGGW